MAARAQRPKGVDLSSFEESIYSQNGEDGIIREIFKRIGTDSKYAVEFGVEDGSECNTRLLKEKHWNVLQMDGGEDNPASIKKEFITAENINDLFKKYKVPEDLDLLSIDIDFNDFYVWRAIDSKYRPRLIVAEYNASVPPSLAKTVQYDRKGMWDGSSDYFGASLLAQYRLGKQKGYSLVYCDKRGVNAFFVRNDLLSDSLPAKTPQQVYCSVGYSKHVRSERKLIDVTEDMYTTKRKSLLHIAMFNFYLRAESRLLSLKRAAQRMLDAPAWYIKGAYVLSARRFGSYYYLRLKRKLRLDRSFYPPGPSSIPIDIFIPTIEKDAQMLALAIKSAKKNIKHPIKNIYIVAPPASLKLKAIAKKNDCKFVDETSILGFKKDKINYQVGALNRDGWIYKMLINLSADKVCESRYILILDADTCFIAPQIFLYRNRPMFNLSNEYHQPYFDATERLLGIHHKLSRSFITHYMLFDADTLKNLRAAIEKKWHKPWHQAIIDTIDKSERSGFADYEIYGDFYLTQNKPRPLLNYWSNESLTLDSFHDLDKVISRLGNGFRSVSLHNYQDTLHDK